MALSSGLIGSMGFAYGGGGLALDVRSQYDAAAQSARNTAQPQFPYGHWLPKAYGERLSASEQDAVHRDIRNGFARFDHMRDAIAYDGPAWNSPAAISPQQPAPQPKPPEFNPLLLLTGDQS